MKTDKFTINGKMEHPFVKTFKTPNSFYIYDVNMGVIQSISKELYSYMNCDKRSEEPTRELYAEIVSLKDKGLLSSHRPIKIDSQVSFDSMRYQLDRRLNQLVLQITQSCNLVCHYCPYADMEDEHLQRSHKNRHMTKNVAIKAIDFFLAHSVEQNDLTLSFYGGEPLIDFELMCETILYAEKVFLGKNLMINMTTNGTLMTDEMIDFLVGHNVVVTVSLDGPKEIHDRNRKKINGDGSYDETVSALKRLVKAYGTRAGEHVMINMVLVPGSDLDKLSLFLKDEFFDAINVTSSLEDDLMLNQKNEISDTYYEMMGYWMFLAYLDYFDMVEGLEIPEFIEVYITIMEKFNMRMMKTNEPLGDIEAPAGPCIPGQHRLFVDVYGNFLPCERVNETSDVMKIGNVDDGFDVNKALSLFNLGSITPEACKNCWAIKKCGLCCRDADGGSSLSAEKKLRRCDGSRGMVEENIKDFLMVKEILEIYK